MEIGSVVNSQYTVIEHVGRGGMADVWSARDQRLRRMVAIKTIARNLSPDIDPVALFEREARTIAQMEHPHILPIYDFGEFEGSLYIVMRYMTGGSLEDVLSHGPMDYADVLQMGQAVAQAMDYAHSNNVIHLDLAKPVEQALRAPHAFPGSCLTDQECSGTCADAAFDLPANDADQILPCRTGEVAVILRQHLDDTGRILQAPGQQRHQITGVTRPVMRQPTQQLDQQLPPAVIQPVDAAFRDTARETDHRLADFQAPGDQSEPSPQILR